MAKAKSESLTNRHLYARVSYLHQAACYLGTAQPAISKLQPTSHEPRDIAQTGRDKQTMSETIARRFVSDIRAVSLKAQIRPSPAVKQMMCKYCDALLVEGKTCSTTVVNPSKGGKKPWADVMVTKCNTCGNSKRFPVSATRQKRRPFREIKDVEMSQPVAMALEQPTGGE